MPDDWIGRPEFIQLQARMERLHVRIDDIDRNGTRGVGRIEYQVTDLIKDVTALQSDVRNWQDSHVKVHEAERADRVRGRRWVVGIVFAGAASVATVIALLLEIAHSIKG